MALSREKRIETLRRIVRLEAHINNPSAPQGADRAVAAWALSRVKRDRAMLALGRKCARRALWNMGVQGL